MSVASALEQLARNTNEEDEDFHLEGKLVQYNVSGETFQATTRTIKRLPSALYTIKCDRSGRPLFERKKLKTDELYIFPDTPSEEILLEVKDFWRVKEAFDNFKFMHKMGILLYGAPGGGKTSCVSLIIAEIIKMKGIVVFGNAIQPSVIIDALEEFRKIEPDRPVLVIFEDLDTLISDYGESEYLSLLDGERSFEGVVVLATTNYPEDLDTRLSNRPGRFDLRIEVGMPSLSDRLYYIEKKLPTEKPETQMLFAKKSEGWSIAHVKELIRQVYCFGKTFEVAYERLTAMHKRVSSEDSSGRKPAGFGGDDDDDDDDDESVPRRKQRRRSLSTRTGQLSDDW